MAYCGNHTTRDRDPRYPTGELRRGDYPFVREDGAMGLAPSTTVRVDDSAYPAAKAPFNILRFPGEPWPPRAEM